MVKQVMFNSLTDGHLLSVEVNCDRLTVQFFNRVLMGGENVDRLIGAILLAYYLILCGVTTAFMKIAGSLNE